MEVQGRHFNEDTRLRTDLKIETDGNFKTSKDLKSG